ncbi:MAG: hypothetical protein GY719_06385 [bacterium]|nr:hypothetical protein [bacterium]
MSSLVKSLGAFLGLAVRPAVIFPAMFVLLIQWILAGFLRGLADFPESHADGILRLGDFVVITTFFFPVLIGLVAGPPLHELQHSSFAWTLPAAHRRVLGGFVASGVALGLFTVLIHAGAGRHLAVVFAFAFTGYCLGAAAPAPAMILVLLPVTIFSRPIGELADTYPAVVMAVAGVVCGVCLWRTFSRSTFRRKPFMPAPQAYSFSAASAARLRREQLVARGPTRRAWSEGYLGTALGRWTRAAVYETYGGMGRKEVLTGVAWLLYVGIYLTVTVGLRARDVQAGRGEGSYLETLGETIHQVVSQPPDMSASSWFLRLVITLLICGVGLGLVASGQPELLRGRLYPLSRKDLGRLAYRNHLVSAGAYCLVTVLICCGLGLAAGLLAGHGLRLDFAPLWLRALLWTLAALPLGHWLHQRAKALDEPLPNLAQAVVAVAIIVGVCCLTLVAALRLPAALELAGVVALIALGQAIFRRQLLRDTATADLI